MKVVTLLFVLLICADVHAQRIATSFSDAVGNPKISVEALDATYKSALHSDSTKAAFNGQEKEFTEAYISLLKDLGAFLKKNNFSWGKDVRCFNRIYFNKEGQIDYFLFHFKKEEFDPAQEEEFKRLLNLFIQPYEFPLKNSVNFAQCSPVKYSDG